MAYNEKLAERVRKALKRRRYPAVTEIEIKMFGGLCWTLQGHMCCGVLKDDLVLRMPGGLYEKALREPHVRPMDFTGRPMRGFVYVGPRGSMTGSSLGKWVRRGVDYALSLPPRQKRTRSGAKTRRSIGV